VSLASTDAADGTGAGPRPVGPSGAPGWLPFRLAVREFRGGLAGFRVFIACIALGVAVITGVGALADMLRAGLGSQGAVLLGGDLAASRPHARATAEERARFEALAGAAGALSETASMRALARRRDGSDRALVELKAVDRAYPLLGAITLSPALPLAEAVHAPRTAAVDPVLLARLGVGIGDTLMIGAVEVRITASVVSEPDKISDRLSYGPRVLLSLETLLETGLAEPGSLVRWRYALRSAPELGQEAGIAGLRAKAASAFPDAGFTIVDRRDPNPQVSRSLERLRQFLTLMGLATLLVGGVGVASAVASWIDRRRHVIAVFKSLGADKATIRWLHVIHVLAMSAIGIVIGLAVGLLLPHAVVAWVGDALPVRAELAVAPRTVALAVAYGLLVALVFALWPLGRAELVRPSVLFREAVEGERVWPRPLIIGAIALALAALVAMTTATVERPTLALWFAGGSAGVLAVFAGLGVLLTRLARALPRPRQPVPALALAGLGAPDGLTRTVVLALGTGLSLLVMVSLVNTSLVAETSERLPKESPSYFLLDLLREDRDRFRETVESVAPGTAVAVAPMLRGRIVALGKRRSEDVRPAPEAQWVLRGDRGLSYSEKVPEGSKVVAGEWWPADWSGEPLVSFEADLAKGLGVGVGDAVTVNVLGRNITARIANLREVKWESLAINFVMVFSPNALAAAPHRLLATLTLPPETPLTTDAALARELSERFPQMTAIRVRDAINAFNAILERVLTAVRIAGSVTLLAGALVLAGGLAATQRRRTRQAVLLRVLGASRARIVAVFALEQLALALVAGLVALALGGAGAWAIVTLLMEMDLAPSWRALAETLGVAIALVSALGSASTLALLRARPVPHLRGA
jgi:putative ABC transport system permease protein